MEISEQDALNLLQSWKDSSAPIFVLAFGGGIGFKFAARVTLVDENDRSVFLTAGDNSLSLRLAGGAFDLEDATEAPPELRDVATSRFVRRLYCVLSVLTQVILIEGWETTDNAPSEIVQ